MMTSQLGRVILAGSTSTEDEMSAHPDQDGRYGPLDEILAAIAAAQAAAESGDDRGPGTESEAD